MSNFRFEGVLQGAADRPYATVAVAGKEIRGRKFSRQALKESVPLWAGDPVMLGSHTFADFGLVADHRDEADNPVVGQVTHASVVGDELRLYPTFNGRLESAMESRGLRDLSDLTGVSLEAIVRGSADDSAFGFTNGFVLLTEEHGACSVADGCRLVACEGNDCGCNGRCKDNDKQGGGQMPEADAGVTEAPITTITMEHVHEAVRAALKANAASEETAEMLSDDDTPAGNIVTLSRADFEELRSMAGAFKERENKQREDLINRLMRLSVYKDASRVDLEGKDVETLIELHRVATEAGAKIETPEERDHILTAHRKAIAPIHGLDTHVATVEPVKPPSDDEVRQRIAEKWGR